jgi:hypothetical protein
VKEDAPGSGTVQAQYTTTGSGFTTAAFPHQTESLVFFDGKTDIIDSLDIANPAPQQPPGDGEVHFKIFYFDDIFMLLDLHYFS